MPSDQTYELQNVQNHKTSIAAKRLLWRLAQPTVRSARHSRIAPNPWTGWAFGITELNPGYGQPDTTGLAGHLAWPNLRLDMVSQTSGTPSTHGLAGHLTWPNLTLDLVSQTSITPPTHGLAGHLASPNLTLDMVSQTSITLPTYGLIGCLP